MKTYTNLNFSLLFLALLASFMLLGSNKAKATEVTAYCVATQETESSGTTYSVTCAGDTGTVCSGAISTSTGLSSSDASTAVTTCQETTYTYTADTNQNSFVQTLCNVLRIVTGNGGKAFAAFAIISLGIGFFTGKVSWGLMVGVAAGIAAMFGAPTIVAAITGQSSFDCTARQ